jgi:hypothetical protein
LLLVHRDERGDLRRAGEVAEMSDWKPPSDEQIARWRIDRYTEALRLRRANDEGAKRGECPRRAAGRRTIAIVCREIVAAIAFGLRRGVSYRYLASSLASVAERARLYWLDPVEPGTGAGDAAHDLTIAVIHYLHRWIPASDLLAACDRVTAARHAPAVAVARALAKDARTKAGLLRVAGVATRALLDDLYRLRGELAAAAIRRVDVLDHALEELRQNVRVAVVHARVGDQCDHEAILGPFRQDDDERHRTSPALLRLRAARLWVVPRTKVGSERVAGAMWLGREAAAWSHRDRPYLRSLVNATWAQTVAFNPRASEATLARDVDRILRAHRRWRRMVDALVADDHPVLERARAMGFTVVRDPAIRDGWGCEIDGSTLRIHARLSEGHAWSLVGSALTRWHVASLAAAVPVEKAA